MKYKLLKGGHLSDKKCREILQLFSDDLTATQIAEASGVSRVTVNNYLKLLRNMIMEYGEANYRNDGWNNVVATTAGTRDKTTGLFYGLHILNERISATLLDSVTTEALGLYSAEKKNGLITSMGFTGGHAIVDFSNWKFFEIGQDDTTDSNPQIIATGFWRYTKSRLQKFRGLNKNTLFLHVKECEFRYNNRNEDLLTTLYQVIDWKYQQNPKASVKQAAALADLL